MKRILNVCITMLISINCLAEVQSPIIATNGKDVIFIEYGTPAPFKGYLFPEDKALKFRRDLIELDYLKSLESSYNKSIELYKKNEDIYQYKVNVLLEQNDKLADSMYKAKDRETWENRVWFVLGMAVTGLGVYAAVKLR